MNSNKTSRTMSTSSQRDPSASLNANYLLEEKCLLIASSNFMFVFSYISPMSPWTWWPMKLCIWMLFFLILSCMFFLHLSELVPTKSGGLLVSLSSSWNNFHWQNVLHLLLSKHVSTSSAQQTLRHDKVKIFEQTKI